jgi:Zn-dependent M28 family amino/carboxypeptidase
LFEGTGLNLKNVEDNAAKNLLTSSMAIKEKTAGFSIVLKVEALKVRNVLGIIPGKDTTKNVIVGAHYDHLGIRNAFIYNGADDNASGVAGMLAIAKIWSKDSQKPATNIIFAAWTAEEKGLLGSSYFAQHTKADTSNFMLTVNLDMISRSSADDSAHLQLSVGTLKGSEVFKAIVQSNNLLLSHPFKLDLWEASKDGGSDYAPFASRNIPVMTFFTGYHDDYHSPRDTFNKVDLSKMKSVLWLANKCLLDFFKDLPD